MNVVQFSRWLVRFLSEVGEELHKIEWPKTKEFIGATIVALVLIVIFSLYFGAIDRIISLLAKQIFAAAY
jgi:preprotein translocase subunit SecE